MKKWLKRSIVAVAGMAGLAAAALFGGAALGDRKLQRHVEVAVAPVAWRGDAAALERGGYLYRSRGCADCHGRDGAGHVVIDDGKGLLIRAPNITGGAGGVVAGYRPADWVRTVRHGVSPTAGRCW